ncbi:hypothetical protein BGZ95_001388 [Linnemannia exigua]|uniref:Uncharacterized protein n=1 Tax=Linnemannia exigua TaxID=604196 RepID=A0AAD4D6Y6_9FUNG|nr:hypothetical protein BGZ95_001388 [Linnemannia exigua]
MKTSLTAVLVAATLLACTSTTSAQAGPRPPPTTGQAVNIMYSNAGNDELGSDDAPFNSCFASENAFAPFAYLTFAPKNATINFYKDPNCQDFTFGLYGYYGGYPGQARSFRWVGWTEDTLGELVQKPIPGQGEAAIHPGGPAPVTPPPSPVPPTEGGGHPSNPPPTTAPDQQTGGGGNGTNYKTSPNFIGGVFGSLVVLSIGGLIFWKTTSKKKVDKGKGLLPYSRGATQEDDNDILLTTHNRSHHNNDETSFSIGDDDDEDSDDDEEDRRHVRRQSNHNDEDEEEEDMLEQKHARSGKHDHYRGDVDHA